MSTKKLSSRYKYDYNIKTKSPIEIDKKLKQLKDILKMYESHMDKNADKSNDINYVVMKGKIEILEWVMGDYDI